MFVLTYQDTINMSSSARHVSEDVEVVAVSDNIKKLQSRAEESGKVHWTDNTCGYAMYEDEIEEGQIYRIVRVKTI